MAARRADDTCFDLLSIAAFLVDSLPPFHDPTRLVPMAPTLNGKFDRVLYMRVVQPSLVTFTARFIGLHRAAVSGPAFTPGETRSLILRFLPPRPPPSAAGAAGGSASRGP
jgi:hypothetical protein